MAFPTKQINGQTTVFEPAYVSVEQDGDLVCRTVYVARPAICGESPIDFDNKAHENALTWGVSDIGGFSYLLAMHDRGFATFRPFAYDPKSSLIAFFTEGESETANDFASIA